MRRQEHEQKFQHPQRWSTKFYVASIRYGDLAYLSHTQNFDKLHKSDIIHTFQDILL